MGRFPFHDVLKGIAAHPSLARARSAATLEPGSTDTPISWYHPEGLQIYRVIYGDLKVQACLPEDLPK